MSWGGRRLDEAPEPVATLAAAHAEAGDFDRATEGGPGPPLAIAGATG